MKSLDEHNAESIKRHSKLNSTLPQPNGISCPECGNELVDSDPTMVLASDPPQRDVHCEVCDYHGYRIA